MDIDPCLIVGGWFLSSSSSSSICMAKTQTPPPPSLRPPPSSPWPLLPSSSSSPRSSSHRLNKTAAATTKHSFLLFYSLLFLSFLFVVTRRPSHELEPSNSVSTLVSTRILDSSPVTVGSSKPTTIAAVATASVSGFRPGRAQKHGPRSPSSSSGRKEFEAAVHEVPSGPNPISN